MLKRVLISAAVVLLVVILAAGIGCALLSRSARKDLAKARAEIKARGDEVTLEMLTGRVPPEENAYRPLSTAFPLLTEALGEGPTDEEKADPFLYAEALKRKVEEGAAFFDALDETLRFTKCAFPVNWEDGPAAELPHLSKIRGAVRALHIRFLWNVAEGRPDDAVRDAEATLKLAGYLENEPALISHLVRIAAISTACRQAQVLLNASDPTLEALLRLKEMLDRIDLREHLHFALRGERDILGRIAFQQLREGKTELVDIPYHPLRKMALDAVPWFLDANEAYYIRQMNQVIDAATLPWSEAKGLIRSIQDEQEADMSQTSLAKVEHVLSHLLLPALLKCHERMAAAQMEVDLAAAGLAVEVYRRRAESHPQDLESLVAAGLLENVPSDAFSGRPIVYRPGGTGFLLYSLGPDEKDDGGNAEDDILFGVERKPANDTEEAQGPAAE